MKKKSKATPASKIKNKLEKAFGSVKFMRIWTINVGVWIANKKVKATLHWLKNALRKYPISSHELDELFEFANTMLGRPVRSAPTGFPDMPSIFRGGYTVHFEIKSENDTQSDHQKAWQKMVEDRGGVYAIVKSPACVARVILNDTKLLNQLTVDECHYLQRILQDEKEQKSNPKA